MASQPDPPAAGHGGGPGHNDLLQLAAELVGISSVSHDEAAIASYIEARLRSCSHLEVERIGDSVIARTHFGHKTRLLLAGHVDTVPPAAGSKCAGAGQSANGSGTVAKHGDSGLARVEGDTLWGLGAVDMKGGVAVLLDLAETAVEVAREATYVFYACEEVSKSDNALAKIASDRPELLDADAAILGEPTGCLIEAGCQGTMRVELTMVGKRAHTARPWQGINAIHRLGQVLQALTEYEPRQVDLNGCVYTEQVQAVAVSGGVAGNVVPDTSTLLINYRFAPDRDGVGAEVSLRDILGASLDEKAGDTFTIVDLAVGAPPALDHPLLARVVATTGSKARAKVGWTDVATLWAAGVPAANFGPGDPMLAHTSDEVITRVELEEARQVLWRVLSED